MFKSINRFFHSLHASFLPLDGELPERTDNRANLNTHNSDPLPVAAAHGNCIDSSSSTTDSFSCGGGGGDGGGGGGGGGE